VVEVVVARISAAIGSLVFLVVAPGVVAGLVPWLLTGWQARPYAWPAQAAGAAVIVAGTAALLASFARFALEGIGTPAPVAPTERLVIGGFYRYVRNPMYLAVGGIIAGQAAALGQPVLVPYLVVFGAAVGAFVRWYEEPTLRQRYGVSYEEYRQAVPGWLPRLTPWRPPDG
jgi:protein-S-isoprenylcysteine O-methyltransferase Ste14